MTNRLCKKFIYQFIILSRESTAYGHEIQSAWAPLIMDNITLAPGSISVPSLRSQIYVQSPRITHPPLHLHPPRERLQYESSRCGGWPRWRLGLPRRGCGSHRMSIVSSRTISNIKSLTFTQSFSFPITMT